MPTASEKLAKARKEEIVNACAELYETMSFNDITLKEIGAKTSFGRTSIYNYFQTKEEIFLALLEKEYGAWAEDLSRIRMTQDPLSADDFADALACTLQKRTCMLKLMAMNLYDLEAKSRLENLAVFKTVYARSLQEISLCLEKFFPCMATKDIQQFTYALFPFLFGVYPYTEVTEKQKKAMAMAHVDYPLYSVYEITRSLIAKLLLPYENDCSNPAE